MAYCWWTVINEKGPKEVLAAHHILIFLEEIVLSIDLFIAISFHHYLEQGPSGGSIHEFTKNIFDFLEFTNYFFGFH